MKSRRIVEQKSSGGRRKGQDREKIVRRRFWAVANSKSKYFLAGTCYLPAFNPLRILFYLRSSLYRMCTVPLPSLHQEKDGATTVQVRRTCEEYYYKGKRRLKESPNKAKTNAGQSSRFTSR
ncbi:hypothetical protein [Sphingobacterium anhuiense]|uniref:hypothetical protein n=1 Tax=Sphingobacterium anhuiense TaxID=493780 RepID=UPI003C307B5C